MPVSPSPETETAGTAGTGVATPGPYEYVGCFQDDREDRVLWRSEIESPDMTPDVSFSRSFPND